METMQDKLIRQKLNSLDTLPEGYAPSLDSKWELLIAGQTEPKKRPTFIWYAVAASLLLLLSFGFLFFQVSNQPEKTVIAQTNAIASSQKSVAFPEEKPENTPEVATLEKAAIQAETIIKNAMPEPVKTKTSAREIAKVQPVFNPETPTQTPEPAVSTSETAPNLLAAENPKMQRRKKTTFVEMDFDAPTKPQMAKTANQLAKVQFRVKILPKEAENTAVVQNEKPLRLQHTF